MLVVKPGCVYASILLPLADSFATFFALVRAKRLHKWGMVYFEIPVVYGAGLLTAAAILIAALVALCFSLHRGGAFADTPRAAARVIRQFSFTPRGVQSPRAYFAGTPRQRFR